MDFTQQEMYHKYFLVRAKEIFDIVTDGEIAASADVDDEVVNTVAQDVDASFNEEAVDDQNMQDAEELLIP